jgi:hypothetical protein
LRRDVIVPEIVMNGLEVPEPFAGERIDGDKRIAKKTRALAIPPVVIVRGRGEGEKRDAALHIDGGDGPHVGAAAAFG